MSYRRQLNSFHNIYFSATTGGRCSTGSGWIATAATSWYVHTFRVAVVLRLWILKIPTWTINIFILLRHLMLEVGQVMVNRKEVTIIRGIRLKNAYFSVMFQACSDNHPQDTFQLYLVWTAPTGMLSPRQVYPSGIAAPGMMFAQQGITSSGAPVQVWTTLQNLKV